MANPYPDIQVTNDKIFPVRADHRVFLHLSYPLTFHFADQTGQNQPVYNVHFSPDAER